MVRSLILGLLLAFSFWHFASAETQPICACFRAPCDCERFVRDLDRQRNRPFAFSHCTGADHKLVQIGKREFCGYTEVNCLQSKSSTPREYTEVTLPSAYCPRPAGGDCPRPRDLTDCVNSDEINERDGNLIASALKKSNCEDEAASAAQLPPKAPVRKVR